MPRKPIGSYCCKLALAATSCKAPTVASEAAPSYNTQAAKPVSSRYGCIPSRTVHRLCHTACAHVLGCAGTLLHRGQFLKRSGSCSNSYRHCDQRLVRATQLSAGPTPAANELAQYEPLPKLSPISRTLARELQHEQRLRARLSDEIELIQRQLQLHSAQHTLVSQQLLSSSNSESSNLDELADDPLFSFATSPSVEQLQRRLVKLRSQLQAASSGSLADVVTGGSLLNKSIILS